MCVSTSTACTARASGFDGELSIALIVREDDTEIARDDVALRGGPILFPHHLQAAERVFVMDIPGSNDALVNALETHLPASTELYRIDSSTYGGDRWVQDFMQTSLVQIPAAGGVDSVPMHTLLHRGRELAGLSAGGVPRARIPVTHTPAATSTPR